MILTKSSADKKLRRMALQIAERNANSKSITIVGIKGSGMVIAKKIGEYLSPVFPGTIETLGLSINKKTAGEVKLETAADLKGKNILLVDDVANSGRTMLYALKPLMEMFPASIETLALVERTYKLFPVALNYVGLSVSTEANQNIAVIVENDEITGAEIG